MLTSAATDAKTAHVAYTEVRPRFAAPSESVNGTYEWFESTMDEDYLITPMEATFSVDKVEYGAADDRDNYSLYWYYQRELDEKLAKVAWGDPLAVKKAISSAKSAAKKGFAKWVKRGRP